MLKEDPSAEEEEEDIKEEAALNFLQSEMIHFWKKTSEEFSKPVVPFAFDR